MQELIFFVHLSIGVTVSVSRDTAARSELHSSCPLNLLYNSWQLHTYDFVLIPVLKSVSE